MALRLHMHFALTQDWCFLGPLSASLNRRSQLIWINVVAVFDVIECLVLTLEHFAAIQQHSITVTIAILSVLDYILSIQFLVNLIC